MRLIIFHLGVYVHCNFAVFMAGEIADQNVIIRIGDQHEDLLLGEEGLTGAGNTKYNGCVVL